MSDRPSICPGHDVLTDLALGEIGGRERGMVLDHLAACPPCQEEVQGLVAAAELVLGATREATPPIGFEAGVAAAIAAGRPRRGPKVFALSAAAVLVVVAFLVGRSIAGPSSQLREATMVTDSGGEVGQVWTYDEDPAWILLSLPGWPVPEYPDSSPVRYELHAGLDDGTEAVVGEVILAEDQSWATTTRIDPTRIRTVTIVDETGHEWCHGTL